MAQAVLEPGTIFKVLLRFSLSNDQHNLQFSPFSSSQANLTHLPRSEFVPGIGLGVGKCPYDPIDNSTAIYVEKGNPGGFPALVRDENITFFFPMTSSTLQRLSHLYLTCLRYEQH
jgi:hypothetical protein